jgi:thiamine biosynthesis lipoprotein
MSTAPMSGMTLVVEVPSVSESGARAARVVPRAFAESGMGVPAMGGRLRLLVACDPSERSRAGRDLGRVAARVGRWAARLTRFSDDSELSALDRQPDRPVSPVGPTLAAVLEWGRAAGRATGGTVDVSMLDARLAAEAMPRGHGRDRAGTGPEAWRVVRSPGGRGSTVERDVAVRFDLDGVAKGWIADRALSLLARYPAALVDADGDIAMRVDARTGWQVGIADPSEAGTDLVRIRPDAVGPRTLGIATSGTTVHRWDADRHHLVDPVTGRPAVTDLEQCTVVAESAGLAEAVAKAVVIRGSGSAEELLRGPGVWGAILLHRSGDVVATSEVLGWLA